MLVIKVELHSAITGKVTEIGKMHIANDRTGTYDYGNYNVTLFRRVSNTPLKVARVVCHNRINNSVWSLVAKALKAVGFKTGSASRKS